MQHLDWFEILSQLRSLATSEAAKNKIQNLGPCRTQPEADQERQHVFNAMQVILTGTRPFMESLDLFENWAVRLRKKAVLKTIEIRDVRSFCLEALALAEVLEKAPSTWSDLIRSQLMPAEEPLSAIDQILTPGGEIRSDASETLYRLFREKENLQRQVENALDKLVKSFDMAPALQDKYVTTREGRLVLPIRSGKQNFMPGVIHGSSQTKQTVFMEPETVVPMNNRLRQIEVEIEDEIERLLYELSAYLQRQSADFERTRDLMEQADVCLAKAQLCLRLEAKDFEFSETQISLRDVKHPLLILSGKPVVGNTVHLNEKKSLLLLSGPNAGGKTVLLKSIGLAAQMARCGLPICADSGSQIPFFKEILLGIGDAQDIEAELSTFAAHLKVLSRAVSLKGFENLILIDEICGSTDPEEGSALARAFIESYSANKVFGVITSHLGPLKTGWAEESQILNGSLEYNSKTGRPTYQFIPGVPGDSMAIQTAKRVGVQMNLIHRSLELLSPETRKRLSGLEEIEKLKADIQGLREDLRREQKKAEQEKEKFQQSQKQLEAEKEKILSKVQKEAQKQIDEMIALAKAEQTFKKHSALQDIKTKLPEIVKAPSGGSGSSSNKDTQITSADEFGKRFPPGSKIFVPNLHQDALIQSVPNSKGEVMILSGSLRMSLPWQQLRPALKTGNPTNEILRRSSTTSFALLDQDRVLDFRGKTVEESLSELEMELDRAVAQKEDRLKVIHGHGTEALKKAVRTYLSRSVYVKKWKAGNSDQGGDGITWVELANN